MKVLGIGGSPRRGGNTDLLLDSVLEGAASAGASVEKIVLNDLVYRPCQECGGCDKTGRCVIGDDLAPVYRKFAEADIVVAASPIFFGDVSAQLKSMIDRFHCKWVAGHVLKKRALPRKKRKGALICASGGDNKKFFENARNTVKRFFNIMDIEYAAGLFFASMDKASQIGKNRAATKKAFKFGEALVKR